jgi:hypothetical protein
MVGGYSVDAEQRTVVEDVVNGFVVNAWLNWRQ